MTAELMNGESIYSELKRARLAVIIFIK